MTLYRDAEYYRRDAVSFVENRFETLSESDAENRHREIRDHLRQETQNVLLERNAEHCSSETR